MKTVSRHSVLLAVLLLAVVSAAGLLGMAAHPDKAFAAPRFDTAGTQVVVYNPRFEDSANSVELKAPKGEKDLSNNLSKCVSSNKAVLDVAYIYSNSIEFTMKKAGTAVVTLTYKDNKYKVKFIVKKYVNPVKTLKVGKANFASRFKKSNYVLDSAGPLKGKINVVAAKNWKLKSIVVNYYNKNFNYKTKTVANGKKVNCVYITLTLKNKKTKAVEKLYIDADTEMD